MRTVPGLVLPLAALVAGCSSHPSAPALTNEAVFEDDRAGLRFVVPDGWLMTMRGVAPPGRLDKPAQLVRFRPPVADRAADLELIAVDLAAAQDIGKYLGEHQPGADKWTAAGPPKPVSAGGADGSRYEYTSATKTGIRREVTAFRRGDRVYLFLTTFGANDTASRDQARLAVESTVWK
jgi:hypothetical protein